MKKLNFILSLILFPLMSFGQNKLPSVIAKDTTLTKDNSPYLINGSLKVNSGVTLKINAGVVIELTAVAMITVNGNLIAQGIVGDSVYFESSVAGQQWGYITGTGSNIELDYAKVTGDRMCIFAGNVNTIRVSHCYIKSTAIGSGEDCIAIEVGKKITIEYVTLIGMGGSIAKGSKNDAIDLDDDDSCFIQHNFISHFSDDAIDIGTNTKYAYISDNIVSYTNYGVTVGESSVAYLVNNISYHNDGGFQVHTGAIIYCTNNTLYANTVGIECFHSEVTTSQTPGTAIVRNTIFSNTKNEDFYTQPTSVYSVIYSISDKQQFDSTGNLESDAMMIDPQNGNFNLAVGSPCIATGRDTLGNKVDMGAIGLPVIQPVVLTSTVTKIFNLSISPNPAIDKVYINNLKKGSIIIVFDLNGHVLFNFGIILKSDYLIDIRNFAKGIYFIKVADLTGNSFTGSFIKE